MHDSSCHAVMTPSCLRICQRFAAMAVGDTSMDVGHLVFAVLAEESLGGQCLQNLGIGLTQVREGCFGDQVAGRVREIAQIRGVETNDALTADEIRKGLGRSEAEFPWVRRIYDRARLIARRGGDGGDVGSHHLVLAMVDVDGPAKEQLALLGVNSATVQSELSGGVSPEVVPLQVDFELSSDSDASAASVPEPNSEAAVASERKVAVLPQRVGALLDANLNRAREGLRVLEDYARFILRDAHISESLKQTRHQLVASERLLRPSASELLSRRDVAQDVGTSVTTSAEMRRDTVNDIVAANARRVQEALRSLEEFGKLLDETFARQIKQLRYRVYELEQSLWLAAAPFAIADDSMSTRTHRVRRLDAARLYVLLSEQLCRLPWKKTVQATLDGGADIIQLREKSLSDSELVSRGHWLADACAAADALFILNDRCDLAVAARADGVHLGQEDTAIRAARAQISSDLLLGISTHDVRQIESACGAEADYLGVGPVFTSQTKQFEQFPGLEFVAAAAAKARCPWFAIGGIDADNVGSVCRAGAVRIAVSSAVIGADAPEAAARELRAAVVRSGPGAKQTIRIRKG